MASQSPPPSGARDRGRPRAGDLLRHWRHQRGRSQLDLAVEANVSARHLSFVETGRAQPSRSLLLALADELDVPLRERNVLLLAAGYAPAYPESRLEGDDASAVREVLAHLLEGHHPYPALVLDRWGDIVLANRAVASLLTGVDADLLAPPINIYRLSLDPRGLAPRIVNRAEWTAHLGHRLVRLAGLTGDPRLADLLAEIRAFPGVEAALHERHEALSRELLLSLTLAGPDGDLRLLSTTTTFGSPRDVTLAELAIESFFPADEATRTALERLAGATSATESQVAPAV